VPPLAAPKGGPPVVPGETAFERLIKHNPKFLHERMAALYAQAEQLPVLIRDAEHQVNLLKEDCEKLKNAPTDPLTLAAVEEHKDVVAARLIADRSKRDYEFYRDAAISPDAPGILVRKQRWDHDRAMLDGVRQEKVNALDGGKRNAQAAKLTAALEAAHRRLAMLQEQQASVKRQLTGAENLLMAMPVPEPVEKAGFFTRTPDGKEFFYDPTRTDLFATDGVYSRLVNHYEMTKLELESPPRVRVLQPASSPTQKDMRKQILGTVFAALLGYGVLAMGAVAYETMARRVSSLGDVRATAAAVVGVIPCNPAGAVGRDPAKRAAANEAVDKLRAYVAQSWLSRGASAVAVTSPLGDEGKAFTAFGLASSLAQAGYKTLLADFDLRDPAVHAYAGVPNAAGVCEMLRGEAELASAVQFLPSGLHLVPAGKWSDEARKAATGERLEALLARLKEPYDCVVLNAHSLLTAAESVEVARRCEVVLVCALYRETTTPLLKKATDRAAALEIPYSGVVYVGATEQEALC
jgi:Mrp family chromosome partitioning ATPase